MSENLTIYGFGAVDELLDLSPFVHKVEAYLPYEKVVGGARRSPNRKLPCARHGDRVIGDSQAILGYLRDVGLADHDTFTMCPRRADTL